MPKKQFLPILIVLVAVLSGCATAGPRPVGEGPEIVTVEQEYGELFAVYNSYGGSVCMGISGPMYDRADAVAKATLNCLQYLALSRRFAMQVEFGTVTDSGFDKVFTERGAIGGTADRIYEEAAQQMEIVDVLWFGGSVGAAVFARLPEMTPIRTEQKVIGISIPEIASYNVAVSSSESSYQGFAEAIEAATFRVAQALMDTDTGTLNVNNTITVTTADHYRSDSYSVFGGRYDGFYVLAYEYNPADKKVYALAALKKQQEQR